MNMVTAILPLSFRAGPGSRAPLVLPVVAFAIVTTLMLTIIGGAQSFWRWDDEMAMMYQLLAVIALILLLIPLASLGGAAARLSARRRDDRLATLRLLGAPASTVRTVTVIESAALALIGSVIGVIASFATLPLIALVHFRGQALGLDGVLLPWWGYITVVLAVTLLALASSLLSLRAVVISPLGVRTRQNAPRLSWLRPVIAVAVVGLGFVLMQTLGSFGDDSAIVAIITITLTVAFGGTLAVLNLVGPFVIGVMAKRAARTAKSAPRLVAARRITEDPKAAWRQVSGVAMTSFMAVFAGTGVSLLSSVDSTGDPEGALMVADIRTGVLITVIGSFLMVACAAGVSQAADVLDRRELSRSLTMLGAPLSMLDAARTRSVMSPLRITSIGSALIAAVLLFPLVGITMLVAPLTLVVIAAVLALGTLLVWGALRATRPLLRQTATVA